MTDFLHIGDHWLRIQPENLLGFQLVIYLIDSITFLFIFQCSGFFEFSFLDVLFICFISVMCRFSNSVALTTLSPLPQLAYSKLFFVIWTDPCPLSTIFL